MPVTTIPLAFVPNQRGLISTSAVPTSDARMVRCIGTSYPNPVTQSNEWFLEKTPGWSSFHTVSSGLDGRAIISTSLAGGTFRVITAFGDDNCTIFSTTPSGSSSTTLGTVDDAGGDTAVMRFVEANVNDDLYVFFGDFGGGSWFVSDASITAANTFTASVTSGATTLSSVSSFSGIEVGQKLAGTGVQSTARVSVIDTSGAKITMTIAANANAAATEITRERIAKIIDDDFTTLTAYGSFCDMDGYVFIAAIDSSGNPLIAHSDLNTPWSWTAANAITPNIADVACGVVKYRDHIVWVGTKSVQFFYNAGNPSGSILSQNDALTIAGVGGTRYKGYSPIVNLAGTVYWIGVTESGLSGVYRLNGFTAENIANAAVTRKLTAVVNTSGNSQLLAFDGFTAWGLSHLYIAINDIGFLYCHETGTWTEAGFFSGGMRIASSPVSTGGQPVYGIRMTGTTGELYKMGRDTAIFLDDGASYTMTIQTPELVLNDGQPFTVHQVEMLGDTQASGLSTLSSCDDDYTTFTVRGAFDMTRQRKVVNRCGHYKNHVIFKLEHSAATAFRAQALKIHWSPAVGRGFR